MEPITTKGSYKTKLNSSVFLGVAYTLNKQHSFSLLFHTRKNLDSRLNVINLGYQYQVAESLQLLASYQNFNGLSNLGTGFVWSPGALQMHLILDNMLAADLFDAKNLFLQLGFSLQFGKKPTVRKTRKKMDFDNHTVNFNYLLYFARHISKSALNFSFAFFFDHLLKVL